MKIREGVATAAAVERASVPAVTGNMPVMAPDEGSPPSVYTTSVPVPAEPAWPSRGCGVAVTSVQSESSLSRLRASLTRPERRLGVWQLPNRRHLKKHQVAGPGRTWSRRRGEALIVPARVTKFMGHVWANAAVVVGRSK